MKTMKANIILGKKQIILASLVLILGVAVYLNWQFANPEKDLAAADAPMDTLLTETDEMLLNNINPLEDANADIAPDVIPGADSDDPASVDTNAADTGVGKNGAVKVNILENADKNAIENPLLDKAEAVNADTPAEAQGEAASKDKQKNLGDALFVSAKALSNETYFSTAKLARTKARDEVTETMSTILNDDKLSENDKKDISQKALVLTDTIEAESRIENLIKAKGFEDCIVYLNASHANVVVKTLGEELTQDSATQIKNIIVSEGMIKGENVAITEIN